MNGVTIHNEMATQCVHIPGAIFISSAESLNLQCDKREAVQQKKTFTTARFMDPCVSSAYRKDLCDPSNQCPKLRKIIVNNLTNVSVIVLFLYPNLFHEMPELFTVHSNLLFWQTPTAYHFCHLRVNRSSLLPRRQKLLRGLSSVHRFGTSTLS